MDQMHTKGGVANFRGAAVGNGVGGAHCPLPVIDTRVDQAGDIFRLEIRMHPAQARAAQSAVLAYLIGNCGALQAGRRRAATASVPSSTTTRA